MTAADDSAMAEAARRQHETVAVPAESAAVASCADRGKMKRVGEAGLPQAQRCARRGRKRRDFDLLWCACGVVHNANLGSTRPYISGPPPPPSLPFLFLLPLLAAASASLPLPRRRSQRRRQRVRFLHHTRPDTSAAPVLGRRPSSANLGHSSSRP
ncbi:hypothetical protein ZWY2020_002331 [Hordeum vulgare]|nr:hypothetical protein ZWY2020_002331 [Hordeum vulgare]